MVRIELLYVDDCPSWQAMARQLDQLAGELGFEWVAVRISSWEQAQARQFHGSPSLHIDGLDPFAAPGAGVGLACRIYPTTSGSAGTPGIDALRHVLAGARDAGRPSG